MNIKELLLLLDVKDILDLPSAIMSRLCGPDTDLFFQALQSIDGWRWDCDSFQMLYEREMSERKDKKQDFTPTAVQDLLAELVGGSHSVHEPTAGNGGLLIRNWWKESSKTYPWSYKPSLHPFDCWELSDRSIPFLLCNLAIRGMVGCVHHGDVLEKEEIHRYILTNNTDDALGYSKIIQVL